MIDIQEFVKACGSAKGAADKLGISKQLMYNWQKGGIPDSVLFKGGKQTETHKLMINEIRKYMRREGLAMGMKR